MYRSFHSLRFGWRYIRFDSQFTQRSANLCFLRAKSKNPFAPFRNDIDRNLFAPHTERFERVLNGGIDVIAFGFDEIHS